MIPANARMVVEWVPLSEIRFDDQNIDWNQVGFYADQLKGHNDHLAPPILNRDMTIRDGRHRLIAHRAVGRQSARCIVVYTKTGQS